MFFQPLDSVFEVLDQLPIKEWSFFGHALIGTCLVEFWLDLSEFGALSAREEQYVGCVIFSIRFDADWSSLWVFGSHVEYRLQIARHVVVGLACGLLGAVHHVGSFKNI